MPRASTDASAALLFLLTGFLALQPLSTDLYLASLPALRGHFSESVSSVQLTLSAFLAGFALSQLIAGPLSDRFGRRPVAVGGCALYVGASLAGMLAPSLWVLIGARVLQAIGVCCTVVCARAIVRDLHEAEAGARVLARALAWMGIAPIAGPVAGGLLQAWLGWRANLAALALLGAILLAAALRTLAETNRHPDPSATDLRALARNYARIAASRRFWAYALPVTGSYGALFCFISGASFVLIEIFGISAQRFGFVYALVTLGYLLGTMALRPLLGRLGLVGAIRIGATVAFASGAAMAAFALADVRTLPAVLGPMFLAVMAHGFIQPACQIGAIDPFPRQAGAAAALMGFTMLSIAALAGWAVGALHDGSTRPLALGVAACGAFCALSAWTLLRSAPAANEDADASVPTTVGAEERA
ncbi:MAG: multidrug effflux MFS transporter [Burkholderiaceae bacterium]|nr:multidrug effflux MFS transporter [Burkholderiaceae bacterium]